MILQGANLNFMVIAAGNDLQCHRGTSEGSRDCCQSNARNCTVSTARAHPRAELGTAAEGHPCNCVQQRSSLSMLHLGCLAAAQKRR